MVPQCHGGCEAALGKGSPSAPGMEGKLHRGAGGRRLLESQAKHEINISFTFFFFKRPVTWE